MRVCSFEKYTCIYSVTIRSIRDVIMNKTHPHINIFKYACLFFRKRYMYIFRHYTLYSGCDIEQNPSPSYIKNFKYAFLFFRKKYMYIVRHYTLYTGCDNEQNPSPYKHFQICVFVLSKKIHVYIPSLYALYGM